MVNEYNSWSNANNETSAVYSQNRNSPQKIEKESINFRGGCLEALVAIGGVIVVAAGILGIVYYFASKGN